MLLPLRMLCFPQLQTHLTMQRRFVSTLFFSSIKLSGKGIPRLLPLGNLIASTRYIRQFACAFGYSHRVSASPSAKNPFDGYAVDT